MAEQLIADAGFDPLHVGGLDHAPTLEAHIAFTMMLGRRRPRGRTSTDSPSRATYREAGHRHAGVEVGGATIAKRSGFRLTGSLLTARHGTTHGTN